MAKKTTDANVTASKRRAAKFSSSDEAKEFAASHRIRLDNTTRSLGQDEFTELERTEAWENEHYQ